MCDYLKLLFCLWFWMNKGYKEKEKKSSAIQMHSFLLELPNFCDFCCHPLLTFRFRPLQLYLIIIMLNIKGTHFKAAEIYDTVHDSRCSDGASWEIKAPICELTFEPREPIRRLTVCRVGLCPWIALHSPSILKKCCRALSAAAASVTLARKHLLYLQSLLKYNYNYRVC